MKKTTTRKMGWGYSKLVLVALAATLLMPFTPAVVHAGYVLDFGDGGASGGAVTRPDSTNVVGTGIPIDVFKFSSGGPMGSPIDLSGSGVFPTDPEGNGAAVMNFSTGGRNYIEIVGGIPAYGIPNGTILLNGSFRNWKVEEVGGVLKFDASGPDLKSTLLLAAVGLPLDTKFEFLGFSYSGSYNPTTGAWTAYSVDVSNQQVPEPATLILIGLGLFGLGVVKRRIG